MHMKKFGWMMLVMLLALCAFGGAALADVYEIEELGLTFELEGDWDIYTGEMAQYIYNYQFDVLSSEDLYTDSVCYFAAIQPPTISSPGVESTSLFVLSVPNMPTFGIVSYRSMGDDFIADLGPIANNAALEAAGPESRGYLLQGKQAVFSVQEMDFAPDTAIVAGTIEQSTVLGIWGYVDATNPSVIPDILDMLASCAFDTPTQVIKPVIDYVTPWCEAYEALVPQYSDLSATKEDDLPELSSQAPQATYRIPNGVVRVLGAEGDAPPHVITMSMWDNENQPLVRDAFVRAAALAMMTTAGQTQADDLAANMRLVEEKIAAEDGFSGYWNNIWLQITVDTQLWRYTLILFPEP
jgi:hypothetical protein